MLGEGPTSPYPVSSDTIGTMSGLRACCAHAAPAKDPASKVPAVTDAGTSMCRVE
jgi:hypothetical protein